MKSIKPGRGPSRQAAAGSLFSIVFGIIWTVAACFMASEAGGIGLIFPLFGLCFVGMGIYNAVYHYKNATDENRTSLMDIVDSDEEPDPWQERSGSRRTSDQAAPQREGAAPAYCPWCGEKLGSDFAFCPKCGRRLP